MWFLISIFFTVICLLDSVWHFTLFSRSRLFLSHFQFWIIHFISFYFIMFYCSASGIVLTFPTFVKFQNRSSLNALKLPAVFLHHFFSRSPSILQQTQSVFREHIFCKFEQVSVTCMLVQCHPSSPATGALTLFRDFMFFTQCNVCTDTGPLVISTILED